MDTLLRLLPPIQRTRGPRLYAANGRRFLDLWLDDGRDILGAAGRSTRTYAANASDKGLVRPYPGLYEHRLEKALLAAWPAFKAVRFFLNEDRALEAAARLLGRTSESLTLLETFDLRLPQEPPGGLVKLRPFTSPAQAYTLALARLPCPGPLGPACLLADDPTRLEAETGDLVPPMLHYAAARALASLERVKQEGRYAEDLWKRFDRRMEPFFMRSGPYLTPRIKPAGYAGFFASALEGGALVSPVYGLPSMVPPEFDDGELKKLAAVLADPRGE